MVIWVMLPRVLIGTSQGGWISGVRKYTAPAMTVLARPGVPGRPRGQARTAPLQQMNQPASCTEQLMAVCFTHRKGDPMKRQIQLLVIDPQNDFCDLPETFRPADPLTGQRVSPALPVAGAHADLQRLAGFVRETVGAWSDIS